MSLFDSYGRRARLYPALLCLPPWFMLGRLAVDQLLPSDSGTFLWASFENASISVGALFLLVQVNRLIAKSIFQDPRSLPTVSFLLHADSGVSSELKRRVRERLESDFSIQLPTLAEERADALSARERLRDAVSLAIAKVGRGTLLLQHNAEYGFVRNLAGGSVLSLGASAVVGLVSWQLGLGASWSSLAGVLAVGYLAVLLVRRQWLASVAEDYARVLFREYLL